MGDPLRTRVVVTGCFQTGKSTLIDCLLGGRYAHTGDGCATTDFCTTYTWTEDAPDVVLAFADPAKPDRRLTVGDFLLSCDAMAQARQSGTSDPLAGVVRATVRLWHPLLTDLDLIDTPGFDASNEHDERAKAGLDLADLAVLITDRAMTPAHRMLLREIEQRQLPVLALFNAGRTGDTVKPDSPATQRIIDGGVRPFIESSKGRQLCDEHCVHCVNLAAYWHGGGYAAQDEARYHDGNMATRSQLTEVLGEFASDRWRRIGGVTRLRNYLRDWRWSQPTTFENMKLRQHAVDAWTRTLTQALSATGCNHG